VNHSNLPPDIETYVVGSRRLYAKTSGGAFAMFDDDLTPEELVAIAQHIAAQRLQASEPDAEPGVTAG
jgi:hypothetical protein